MKRLLRIALLLCLALPASADPPSFYEVFPGVGLLTQFAHDYGDRLVKVTYQGVEYEPSQATAAVLPLHGWNDPSRRLRLGEAWAREMAFPGFRVLTNEPAAFTSGAPFTAPKSEILPDGTFRYTAWTEQTTGRNPGGLLLQQAEIDAEARMSVLPSTRATTPQPLSRPARLP